MITRSLRVPLVGLRLRPSRCFSICAAVHQAVPRTNDTSRKKPVINFPFLKDKTGLIKQLHKNTNLPFNVARDILNVPLASPEEVDNVSGVWVRYLGSGDEDEIITTLESIEDLNNFWLVTLKIALSDTMFMNNLITLIKTGKLAPFTQQLSFPLAETLVASLINSQRFDSAYYVFRDLLQNSENINWDPIFNVCLVSEEPYSLQTLMLIHGEFEHKIYYKMITHLFHLKLQDHYIHKWSSILIRYNDFPKDSSQSLNPVFESILKTKNLKSFDHCISWLGKSIENPKQWLDSKTIKLISEYIIASNNQEGNLTRIFNIFGMEPFSTEEFWVPLLYKSGIRTKTLQTFMNKTGIDSIQSYRLSEALSHRLVEEDPDTFMSTFSQKLDQNIPASFDTSLKILKLHLKNSNNHQKASDFVIHMLETFPNQAKITASTYLAELMKTYEDGDFDFWENFIKFEHYLQERDLLKQSKIAGALVYANLKLSRFGRAIEDIKILIDNDQDIDPRTIHHSYEILKKNHRRIPNNLIDKNLNIKEFILKLVIKMSKKCKEISPVTYNIILRDIVWTFSPKDSESLLCEFAEYLKTRQETNVHSSHKTHILKQVFDKELTSDILKRGFRNAKEPWIGLILVKKLQDKGVHIEVSKVRSECLKYLDSLSLSNSDQSQSKLPWFNPAIGPPAVDHGLFLSKVNEMMGINA